MRLPLLALLLCLPATVFAAPLPGVPTTGRSAADFAPKGWAVESELAGELSGDARPDLVVVLVKAPAGDAERPRALLWLQGAEGGGYSLLTSNVGLLACVACLGINGGEAAPTLSIAKRVLLVEQEGGSREAYGSTHRFRLEAEGVRLIGLDEHTLDRGTGEATTKSTNFLTGAHVEERAGKATKSKRPVAKLTPFDAVIGYGGP